MLYTIIYNEEENNEFLEFFGIDETSNLPQIFLTKIDHYLQKLDRYEYPKVNYKHEHNIYII